MDIAKTTHTLDRILLQHRRYNTREGMPIMVSENTAHEECKLSNFPPCEFVEHPSSVAASDYRPDQYSRASRYPYQDTSSQSSYHTGNRAPAPHPSTSFRDPHPSTSFYATHPSGSFHAPPTFPLPQGYYASSSYTSQPSSHAHSSYTRRPAGAPYPTWP